MKLVGFCERCRRIRLVNVRRLTFVAGTPVGVCDDCESKKNNKNRRR